MAPEVILGMEYDEKVDVYSYGVVLLGTYHKTSSCDLVHILN
jgi:serine/threonine protein kinase